MDYDFLKIKKSKNISEIYNLAASGLKISDTVDKTVEKILKEIKANGDKAGVKFCRQFDHYEVKNIDDTRVKAEEIKSAMTVVKKEFPKLAEAFEASRKNIENYHTTQFKKEPGSWYITPGRGKEVGQITRPLERIGIYIPGGRYTYPSSVLMAVIPAMIVKVKEFFTCTPPQPDGSLNTVLLYLLGKLKIKEAYKIGGAQAIGILAYGSESIKKGDKIAGPGNIYVTAAKKKVFGDVGIDSLAGPSDVTIIADNSSNASFIAADLISQAEHDPDARSILLTTSIDTAKETIENIYKHLEALVNEYSNKVNMEVILKSLKKNCRIIYSKEEDLLIKICNIIAPEHLEIMVKDTERILKKIKNAGAVFIGDYCPVAVGDYTGGTNHVIPTNGNARFASPLSVSDFLKRSSITFYNENSLKKEIKSIKVISGLEKLFAHGYSVKVRLKKK